MVVAGLMNLRAEVFCIVVTFEEIHSAASFSIQKPGIIGLISEKWVGMGLMVSWWFIWLLFFGRLELPFVMVTPQLYQLHRRHIC